MLKVCGAPAIENRSRNTVGLMHNGEEGLHHSSESRKIYSIVKNNEKDHAL